MTETMVVGLLEFSMENRAAGPDGGPSMRVCSVVEGHLVELLRFDMFLKEPHYHYDPAGADLRYHLDPIIYTDTVGWVIEQLRQRLPEMVTQAGQPSISDTIDVAEVENSLPEMERRWRALI